MSRTIAITTPTGNVGSKIVDQLLQLAQANDVSIVLLARKAQAVAHWQHRGVRVIVGLLEDPEFMVRATRGVEALYLATPHSFAPELSLRAGYRQFASAAARAIEANQIPHTVHLSVAFTGVNDGAGDSSIFGGLADTEAILDAAVARLQASDLHATFGITHLRAGFFFENFIGQLDTLRGKDTIYIPANQAVRIPMVASRDVADHAVASLLRDRVSGRVIQSVLGPEDLSFSQVAERLTTGMGRTVRVTRIPLILFRRQALKNGRDRRMASAFTALFKSVSKGRLVPEPRRDASSTTGTSLQQWARDTLRPLVDQTDGPVCPARVQYEPAADGQRHAGG